MGLGPDTDQWDSSTTRKNEVQKEETQRPETREDKVTVLKHFVNYINLISSQMYAILSLA